MGRKVYEPHFSHPGGSMHWLDAKALDCSRGAFCGGSDTGGVKRKHGRRSTTDKGNNSRDVDQGKESGLANSTSTKANVNVGKSAQSSTRPTTTAMNGESVKDGGSKDARKREKELEAEFKSLESERATLQKQAENLRRSLDDMTQARGKDNAEHNLIVSSMAQEVYKLKVESSKLRDQLNGAKSRSLAAPVCDTPSEATSMLARLGGKGALVAAIPVTLFFVATPALWVGRRRWSRSKRRRHAPLETVAGGAEKETALETLESAYIRLSKERSILGDAAVYLDEACTAVRVLRAASETAQEEITSLENDRNEAKARSERLVTELEKVERERSSLKHQVKQLTTSARSAEAAAAAHRAGLENEANTLRDQLVSVRDEAQRVAEKASASIISQLEAVRASLVELEQERLRLLRERSDLLTSTSALELQLNEANAKAAAANQSRASLEASQLQLEAEITLLLEERQTRDDKISHLTVQLNVRSAELTALRQNKAAEEGAIEGEKLRGDAILHEKDASIKASKAIEEELQKRLEAIEKTSSSTTAQLEAVRASLVELEQERLRLLKERSDLLTSTTALESQLNEANTKISTVTRESESAAARIASLISELERVETDRNELKVQLTQAQASAAEHERVLVSRIQEKNDKEKDQLQKEFEERFSQISERCLRLVHDMSSQREAYEARLAVAEAVSRSQPPIQQSIENNTASSTPRKCIGGEECNGSPEDERSRKMDQLKAALEEAKAAEERALAAVVEEKQRAEALTNKMKDKDEESLRVNEQLSQKATEVTNLEAAVASLEGQLRVKASTVKHLWEKVGAMRRSGSAGEDSLRAQIEEISQHKMRLERLNQEQAEALERQSARNRVREDSIARAVLNRLQAPGAQSSTAVGSSGTGSSTNGNLKRASSMTSAEASEAAAAAARDYDRMRKLSSRVRKQEVELEELRAMLHTLAELERADETQQQKLKDWCNRHISSSATSSEGAPSTTVMSSTESLTFTTPNKTGAGAANNSSSMNGTDGHMMMSSKFNVEAEDAADDATVVGLYNKSPLSMAAAANLIGEADMKDIVTWFATRNEARSRVLRKFEVHQHRIKERAAALPSPPSAAPTPPRHPPVHQTSASKQSLSDASANVANSSTKEPSKDKVKDVSKEREGSGHTSMLKKESPLKRSSVVSGTSVSSTTSSSRAKALMPGLKRPSPPSSTSSTVK